MMKNKRTVLITSAGTASAISVIKALKKFTNEEFHIVAVDIDSTAAGLYLADQFFLVAPFTSEDYIHQLCEIAKKTGATYLFPIFSKEIPVIAANQSILSAAGLKTFLPQPDAIKLCNDKTEMYRIAEEGHFAPPKTYTLAEGATLPHTFFPLFAKPVEGSSSTGARMISDHEQLAHLHGEQKPYLIQELLTGSEITVDVLCDRSHQPLVVAPRIRLATKAGQSVKGRTIDNTPFIPLIHRICEAFKVVGVCNVQFFQTGEELRFLEVNPRFAAGGLMLTVAAGMNIPAMLIDLMDGRQVKPLLDLKKNLLMTRYWEEIIIETDERQ